ncbi:sigma factor [Kribbella sp. NPDC051620]|uniref:sigma factor n=1 Tax=Kribbella sp. NPDC051620 TaxID=3364120 RepID=UPI0037A4426C
MDFEVRTAPFRRELPALCYRMSGSNHDAEDLLQETMIRAWRASTGTTRRAPRYVPGSTGSPPIPASPLQVLPAKQRTVLILRDVLAWSAAETAEVLEPDDPKCVDFLNRYIEAFERADVVAFTDLLTEDVLLEMPPFYNWFRGRDHHLRFVARVFELRGTDWRVHPIAAGISHNHTFQDDQVFAAFKLAGTA